MFRKILIWPDPKLKALNAEILDALSEKDLIEDLIDTCNVHMGAGLAAPQIGINKRVVIIKPRVFGIDNPDPSEYNDDYMVLINPVLELTGDDVKWKESCLSMPNIDSMIIRKETTLIKYTSEAGEEKRLIAEWPFSGGLQHECDHLNGKLFIHRMDKRKAAFLLERWRKKKRKQRIKAKRARK
jgi:peptide deformylase